MSLPITYLNAPSRRHGHRVHGGFSLVEVMITIGLLTIALGAMVEILGNQSQRRRLDECQVAASSIAAQVSQRILTARWDWLGTERLPWSYGRYLCLQGTSGARPPMTFAATAGQDNLVIQGLVPKGVLQTGSEQGLEVYVEWYRGFDAPTDSGVTSPGVFSATSAITSTTAFRKTIQIDGALALDAPVKTTYRVIDMGAGPWNPALGISPTAYVDTGEPLVARIIVRWDAKTGVFSVPGSIVLWVARSP